MSKIIQGTKVKSFQLDPLPAVLPKQYLDILLPVLNLSLSQDIVPGCMKEAPLDLKQSSLEYELVSNYRPISNLMFTSKLCERVVDYSVSFPI